MQILKVTTEHLASWVVVRRQLWPVPDHHHQQEMQAILDSSSMTAFLLFNDIHEPIGFVEGAIYLSESLKYGYVEGWYVVPNFRGQGWGGRLLGALEQWILERAITLVLSDTIPQEFPLSTHAHEENGFRELMTLKVFIKQLDAEQGTAPSDS